MKGTELRISDICLAVFVTAIWGFNFVVIKVGIDAFPPLFFSALRFMLSAFPLIFFLPRPPVDWRILVGIGVMLGIIKFALLFVGMDVGLSAGLASLVLQCQAFFTVLLAALILKERPTMQQCAGMFVAFCGISLISLTVDQNVTILGLTLVVLAGLSWGFSNLLMKQAGRVNMLHLMVWVSLIPPIPLLLLSLLFEGWQADLAALQQIDWRGVGALLFVAFASTILGFSIWGRLISIYGAGQVAPFSLLVPIFGMGSSAVFLGETFDQTRMIAALLVFIGLALTVVQLPALKRAE